MGSVSSSLFAGNSRFATDFKSVIDRAVAIASLPLQQMENERQSLADEASALSSLDSKFASLQTAMSALASATSSGNTYSSSVSESTVLTATQSVSGKPLTGSYSIVVQKLGSYTTANSAPGLATVSDPDRASVSAASSFTLTTASGTFTLTPSANTLNALADAINAETSSNVSATVINVGSTSTPDYRLSLQSTRLGPVSIGLSDSLHSVLDTPSTTEVSTAAGLTFRAQSSFTLTVEGQSNPFVLSGVSSLDALAGQINALGITGISATVNSSTGRVDITKPDGTNVGLSQNLIDMPTGDAAGSLATYTINGSDTISTDSRSVTLAAGLTANLLKTGSTTVTVSRSTSGISSAISSFVTAYNAAADEIRNHFSAEKSGLDGNSILLTASAVLSSLVTYTGSGKFPALVIGKSMVEDDQDIGLSIDNAGKLSFDTSKFAKNTSGKIDDLLTLLGDTTTSGFLKSATDLLNSLEDTTSGTLKMTISSVKDEMKSADSRISAKGDQISELQRNLEAQMAAADAAIAMLEQQVSYLTGMFESMRVAAKSS